MSMKVIQCELIEERLLDGLMQDQKSIRENPSPPEAE
jgi:hypothetical protein